MTSESYLWTFQTELENAFLESNIKSEMLCWQCEMYKHQIGKHQPFLTLNSCIFFTSEVNTNEIFFVQHRVFENRGGSSFDEKGGAMLKWWQVFNRGSGSMFPENVLDFGSLKRHFLHFEDTFEQNIKVSNHIIIRLSHHIFKKYFGPNEIIPTLSVSLHEIAKLDMVDVT